MDEVESREAKKRKAKKKKSKKDKKHRKGKDSHKVKDSTGKKKKGTCKKRKRLHYKTLSSSGSSHSRRRRRGQLSEKPACTGSAILIESSDTDGDDADDIVVEAAGAKGPCSSRLEKEFLRHVASGDICVVQRLLQQGGFNVMAAMPETGENALHLCARLGIRHISEAMMILLLNAIPLAVKLSNVKGETPLHTAVQYSRGDVAELLLEAGADPSTADFEGYTVEADGSLKRLLDTLHQKRHEQQKAYRKRLADEEFADTLWLAGEEDAHDGGPSSLFDGSFSDLEAESDGEDWMEAIRREYQERCEQNRAQERRSTDSKSEEVPKENPFKRLFEASSSSSRSKVSKTQAKDAASDASEAAAARIREAHERSWADFEEKLARKIHQGHTPSLNLKVSDIPWPSGPPANPILLHAGMPKQLALGAIRDALRRWHPDKLMGRCELHLAADVKEEVAERAKALSQQLNAMKEQLTARVLFAAVSQQT
eukprot:TRINITY_DN112141_c0_g1_i1.p1 TRINITY_DN112141_c0_g1~~TRINITY_DN112141_c0_g1_i1.p1  ORF type:complete len:484 (-),score=140.18 TRINITY_DN112141_c0_g1_i1:424-1875(-)